MPSLVLLAGSLRRSSLNARLAHALAGLAPEDWDCAVATPAGIPLYDGDAEEAEGIPPAVAALKERIAAADGLVLVTPEYNQGVPGVLKNTIDWLSRPPRDIGRVLRGRPVALCGASPSPVGTRTAQYAWLPTLRGLGMQQWAGGSLFVGSAGDAFDADGDLADPELRRRAEAFITDFGRWAAARQRLAAE